MSTTQEFLELQRARNLLQTCVLLGGMFGLFGVFGWALGFGGGGIVLLGLAGLVTASLGARMSAGLVLRMYGARPLRRDEAPGLHQMLADLASRAGLASYPVPHYVPTRLVNAFAVGTPQRAALGITDGILRTLSPRELRGVLAHEITHVANRDSWVMSLADWVTRMVNLFAWIGQILLFITLPAVLVGASAPLPFTFLLLMIFAPTLSALLQLALSRSREYDADLGAARLTGDPRGLASALQKMERVQGGFIERIFMPGRRVPEPSLLRTHPPTEERVRRLLAAEERLARDRVQAAPDIAVLDRLPSRPAHGPRWHYLGGSWH